jgi:hypothetical protein
MSSKRVAIVSLAEDLHALVIQKALADRHGVACSIVEANRICDNPGLAWSNLSRYPPTLPTTSGPVDVRTLDLVWWRRGNVFSIVPADVTDPAHLDLIDNDARFAVLGVLLTEFSGVWISDPYATRRAQNKLVQLRVAKVAGFQTPHTLVSQDPDQIRSFCGTFNNKVIAKAVRGTTKRPTVTILLTDAMLQADDSLRICPTIYQELVVGTCHVRATCFGDHVYAAVIESNELDWRPNLDVPVRAVDLDAKIASGLLEILSVFGLKMGVFDLKLNARGEPIWLELNPQGQFLFIEGLCGLKLIDGFCEFLRAELSGVKTGATTTSS